MASTHPTPVATSVPANAEAPDAAADGLLLGGVVFGAAPAARPAEAPHPEAASALRLTVKGLKAAERELLEALVKVSQHRNPRLEILHEHRVREADVVMVDAADAAAVAWAQQRPWLARRPVIWIDGSDIPAGHTLLRRPVQWPALPMVLARALEAGPETAAVPAPPPGAVARMAPHILVVDDSAAVRAQLRALLEPAGYDVTEADSVAAALQQVRQRHFDCVLMDVVMPGVDGYEGCRQIKAERHGAGATPVVMLTSRGSPFDHLHGKMAGCDAYLTKPIEPQHLAEVLAQQVVTARRAAGSARAGAVVIPTRRY